MDHQTVVPLHVSVKTWSRDSHGLFDYESRSITLNEFHLTSDCNFRRTESAVERAFDNSGLLSVSFSEGRYTVSSEEMWSVVQEQRRLAVGDILKMGRIRMLVRELRGLNDQDPSVQTQDSSEDELEVPSEREIGQCRVCLCEDSPEDNPLLAPCACLGTVKYIHLECLQRWLEAKRVVREGENSINYFWKSMDCELCKEPYPFILRAEGKSVYLLQKERSVSPYIIFEVLGQGGVYVISLVNKYCAKLGRGHDSDARISDISVSRVHATVYYKDGEFYFEDNHSKFGSLIMVKQSVEIKPNEALKLQVGRSVFSFRLGQENRD